MISTCLLLNLTPLLDERTQLLLGGSAGGFIDLEKQTSIVGDPIVSNIRAKTPPFFYHSSLNEEFALTSLLWDLYDNTPAEANDKVFLPFNNLINSLIVSRTTSSYHDNLMAVIPSIDIDNLFVSFSIYVDKNKDAKYDVTEVVGKSAWDACVPIKKKPVCKIGSIDVYGYLPPGRD